jgi:hypothetical protein
MPQPFFTIEMLAAKHGDALWIEYRTEGGRTRPPDVVTSRTPLIVAATWFCRSE